MKPAKRPGGLSELIDQCLQGLTAKKTNCSRTYENRLLYEFNLILGALPNPMQLRDITIKPAPKENYEIDKLFDQYDHLQRLNNIIALKEHMLQNKIPFSAGSGRACGSLVLYALGITEIDPVRFNLSANHFYASLYKSDPLQVFFRIPVEHHKKMIEYCSKKYVRGTGLQLFPPVDNLTTWLFCQSLQQLNSLVCEINKNRTRPLLLEEIPLDDQKTFDLIASGNTAGIYGLNGRIKNNHRYSSDLEARNQICLEDSGLIKETLQQFKPENFSELMTVIGLLHLVPVKQGDNYLRELAIFKNNIPLKHPHRTIENTFTDTYGIPFYREQLFQLVKELAGDKYKTFTEHNWKAFSTPLIKEKQWLFQSLRKRFIRHASLKGYNRQSSYYLFDLILAYVKQVILKANTANQTLLT